MKSLKPIFLVALILLLSSCSIERSMQKSLNKVYIGMPLSEFKKELKKTSLVYMGNGYSCYQLTKSKAVYTGFENQLHSTRFFYFQNNKLWKMDEGVRAVDYR